MLNSTTSWQKELSSVISDPAVLCQLLDLELSDLENIYPAIEQFPLRVPHSFLSRIKKGDLNDPLLKQVLPLGVEMQSIPGYSNDPLYEDQYNPVPGLLHKYRGRVLLTLTGACAINCRYCFRRHYPYSEKVPGISQWHPALEYIEKDNSINEVILSGGDPLLIKDNVLSNFIDDLEKIAHLNVLRIHTRLPIVIPNRVTNELIDVLKKTRLNVVIVLHCNHANELDLSVENAVKKLKKFTLLNQSVLLNGINDSEEALSQLSHRLLALNVLPYYLHLLDPVSGTAHFDVSEEKGKKIIQNMTKRLPGYLVPRLVKEVAGMESKQSL